MIILPTNSVESLFSYLFVKVNSPNQLDMIVIMSNWFGEFTLTSKYLNNDSAPLVGKIIILSLRDIDYYLTNLHNNTIKFLSIF